MDFTINENQKMIADMVRQFGKQNITPFVREWDDNQTFPVDVFKKLGELVSYPGLKLSSIFKSFYKNKENILAGTLGDVYGGLINSENIPENLINAVIVLEDRRFFDHFGIDFKGLSRAIFENLKDMRYSQGASTITQQLSKLIFLNAEKTLSRKLRELIIAFYLEYRFTKVEILSMYLNILLLNSGIAALGGYFPHSLKLTDNSCLTKSGIFRVGSPNDIFNIG